LTDCIDNRRRPSQLRGTNLR